MKSLQEEFARSGFLNNGDISLDKGEVRDFVNVLLDSETKNGFVTPYIAYERASKVMANFGVALPRTQFLAGKRGFVVIPISQFGAITGADGDGQVKTKLVDEYHLFFEWRSDPRGFYRIFAELVTNSELSSLLSAVEKEMAFSGNDLARERGIKLMEAHNAADAQVKSIQYRQAREKKIDDLKDVARDRAKGPKAKYAVSHLPDDQYKKYVDKTLLKIRRYGQAHDAATKIVKKKLAEAKDAAAERAAISRGKTPEEKEALTKRYLKKSGIGKKVAVSAYKNNKEVEAKSMEKRATATGSSSIHQ